ncbi:hypothetical protein AHAT_17250 [Agarivorans sp. Toyoura001]|nr:hypothetical protein AHAT_17250 [Agarivorans sp. Toyoura001]
MRNLIKLVAYKIGWQPYQPHPGTRVVCCGCSLPGLAEFTEYQCGRTNRATIDELPKKRGYSRLSLAVLQTLKTLFNPAKRLFAQVLILISLIASPLALAESFDHSQWDGLLKEYVHWPVANQESRVDYANFDRQELQAYLDKLASITQSEFDAWSDNEQLAFLINAYNAYTVQYILSAYPNITSIRDLGNLFQSPWKKKRFMLFGEKVSLDHIEHDLIRPGYNNPHIHAAVVCAAISCPPLQSVAYTGDAVEQQIKQAFKEFLQSNKNHYDKESNRLKLSSIFKWYKGDFGKSLNNYLSDYAVDLRMTPEQMKAAKISYLDYDWSLNDYR